jgi:glycosyltransferase involved in cell wall biosynthesis
MNQETFSEKERTDEKPLSLSKRHRPHRRRSAKRKAITIEKTMAPGDGRDISSAIDSLPTTATTRSLLNSMPQASRRSHAEGVALSIVIPLYNEAESLLELYEQLNAVTNRMRGRAEIIFVDDGSTDDSFAILRRLQQRDRQVRVVQFRRNYGKSAALAAGFARARGRQIVTMDADLQDDPEEIPRLVEALNKGYDLISGWKKRRYDRLSKRLASKVFNAVTNLMTGVRLHDINCGLKAYRREVTDSIRVYGQLHRYLPVLAFKEGFRVGEVEVRHHPRKYGQTKFGLSRYTSGFFDLLTVLFLTRYTKRPLHLFGLAGLISFMIGFGISAYLTYERLVHLRYLTNRPILYLGILLIIVGVQMISFGLLGEMITAIRKESLDYTIKSELG